MTVTVETRCAHCSEAMTLEIDSDMKVRVDQDDAAPMIFTPDVDVFDIEAPSIVDDF